MQITVENVQALNPCQSRFENFTKEYPGFNSSHQMFLSLEKITYSDKVWVMTRLMSHKQNSLWAAACAESVLHLTREQDRGVCQAAIDAVRKFIKGEIARDELIAARRAFATHAANAANAAYAAYAAVTYAAVTHATNAANAANAAYAAHAANAAHAAVTYATHATNAAVVASYSIDAAVFHPSKQQQICLNLLLEILNY
jgi:hypothetical protein